MPYKDKEKAKEYQKEYQKGWYQRHKDEVIERKKQRQQDIHNWFRRYKSTLYCMDCGISHPAVLQFHHRSRADKSFTISSIVSRATSVKQITNEIKKCDVLCVNCHAKRHWRETHGSDSWEELLPSKEE
ncbi:MAG TPA: hypothetical protein DDW33_11660 [Ktedonobacter sp.]|jgi:hypothetical protein|nr:hypothetical protein [Ktedonobacter sp.]